jgi:FO synthase
MPVLRVRRERDVDSLRLSLDEVAVRTVEAAEAGATEACMQGGIDQLPIPSTPTWSAPCAPRWPAMHVRAFSR